MNRPGDGGALSAAQQIDLQKRLGRFRAGWSASAVPDIADFLPIPTAEHRTAVLVELIRADMNLRAAASLGVDLASYLAAFPNDLPTDAIPATLLAEEYFLRQQAGGNPGQQSYQDRFPGQFAAFLTLIGAATPPEMGRPDNSPPAVTRSVNPGSIPAASRANTTMTHAPVSSLSFDEPLTKTTDTPASANPGSNASLEYRTVRLLGHGMFGEVYEAIAPGGFRVALKKMLRHADHPATRQELTALESIQSMSHPFLLQTHAFWIDGGNVNIVMELAEGTLADRTKEFKAKGKMGVPAEELVPYFEQAAEAFDYLHSQNVSHRDVKPQNMLYLKGYCKVADFGLVHVHQSSQTTVGNTSGTPSYMAPEAWDGKVSLHSDQYSLAATYVNARLGRGLYDSQVMYELARCHKMETPDLDPLPEAEQKVLLRALAKKPNQRFPNCKAFAAALREAVMPAPVTSSQSVMIVPPAPASLLSRVLPGVLTAAVCVAGVFLALDYFRPGTETPPTKPVALTPPWCPDGWTAVEEAGIDTLDDGTRYHKQVSRQVGDDTLIAIAVPRTANVEPSDLPLFYMLRDKVTNRQFQTAWEDAQGTPKSALAMVRRNLDDRAKWLLPGVWRQGAISRATGDDLGITGPQANVPVVGVTMPEAAIVAEAWGGDLPTYDQWQRATGFWDSRSGFSTAGDPADLDLGPAPPRTTGIALNLMTGPWPITRTTPDESIYGIRELVSNGDEWTCQENDGTLVSVYNLPQLPPKVLVVGRPIDTDTVLTFGRMAEYRRVFEISDAAAQIGFRVVLLPE